MDKKTEQSRIFQYLVIILNLNDLRNMFTHLSNLRNLNP